MRFKGFSDHQREGITTQRTYSEYFIYTVFWDVKVLWRYSSYTSPNILYSYEVF